MNISVICHRLVFIYALKSLVAYFWNLSLLLFIMFKAPCLSKAIIFQTPVKQFLRISKRWRSIYEPEFLDYKPELPVYESLVIKMKAYDFVPLETYAKYVHAKCKRLGLIASCYPVPSVTSDVNIFIPGSVNVSKTYHMSLYERVVKIEELTSTLAPVFIELLHRQLPAAVQLTIDKATVEEEEYRYVPDLAMLEMQAEIDKIRKLQEDRKK